MRKRRDGAVGRRPISTGRLRVLHDVQPDILNLARIGHIFHGVVEQILRPAAVGVFEDDVIERIALFILKPD